MEKQSNVKNCKDEISMNLCSNCESPKELKRIDRNYIISEISSVLNFDKGILYTIKELVIRPGATIRKFLHEDRNRLVKPVIFIIISSLIYTFLRHVFNFEDGYIYYDSSIKSTSMNLFAWIKNNYGYGNLIMGVFIAFWTKVFFRKYDYNFYEILILLCFVLGIGMLTLALFGTIEGLTKLKVLQFGAWIFVGYYTWAIGQFFDKKKASSYLKAFASWLLGMITFTMGIFLIGKLIDLV